METVTHACVIDGCAKPRYQKRRMCSTHVMRAHRYGDPLIDRTRTGRSWTNAAGYIMVGAPGHPIANTHGAAYQHRLVLYESIGPGKHSCHWCGDTIEWMVDLEADHVDNDRTNNIASNIVASCHGCNTRRALYRRHHSRKHNH